MFKIKTHAKNISSKKIGNSHAAVNTVNFGHCLIITMERRFCTLIASLVIKSKFCKFSTHHSPVFFSWNKDLVDTKEISRNKARNTAVLILLMRTQSKRNKIVWLFRVETIFNLNRKYSCQCVNPFLR